LQKISTPAEHGGGNQHSNRIVTELALDNRAPKKVLAKKLKDSAEHRLAVRHAIVIMVTPAEGLHTDGHEPTGNSGANPIRIFMPICTTG
jgi:hypothetical protein